MAALALLLVGVVAVLGYAAYDRATCAGSGLGRSCHRTSSDKIVHFTVTAEDARMTFTAYELAGQVYVRAAICPPCRSESFSLKKDTLVCNTCGTEFRASDGQGTSGACKGYPKAEVAHTIAGDRLTMNVVDLVAELRLTLSRAE